MDQALPMPRHAVTHVVVLLLHEWAPCVWGMLISSSTLPAYIMADDQLKLLCLLVRP
jgi:hypothetical protein